MLKGPGWAALTYCDEPDGSMVIQIKHNVNVFPDFPIIMGLDVWEQAYYIDYRNASAKFIDAFWKLVNWDGVSDRFSALRG